MLIAPEGNKSSSPPIVYPELILGVFLACLSLSPSSFTGKRRLENSVALSLSFTSLPLLVSSSRALSTSPLSWSRVASERSFLNA